MPATASPILTGVALFQGQNTTGMEKTATSSWFKEGETIKGELLKKNKNIIVVGKPVFKKPKGIDNKASYWRRQS